MDFAGAAVRVLKRTVRRCAITVEFLRPCHNRLRGGSPGWVHNTPDFGGGSWIFSRAAEKPVPKPPVSSRNHAGPPDPMRPFRNSKRTYAQLSERGSVRQQLRRGKNGGSWARDFFRGHCDVRIAIKLYQISGNTILITAGVKNRREHRAPRKDARGLDAIRARRRGTIARLNTYGKSGRGCGR